MYTNDPKFYKAHKSFRRSFDANMIMISILVGYAIIIQVLYFLGQESLTFVTVNDLTVIVVELLLCTWSIIYSGTVMYMEILQAIENKEFKNVSSNRQCSGTAAKN